MRRTAARLHVRVREYIARAIFFWTPRQGPGDCRQRIAIGPGRTQNHSRNREYDAHGTLLRATNLRIGGRPSQELAVHQSERQLVAQGE